MPAVIKLGGVREGFNVFVSTISKFPSEDSNQGKYENNKRMEFSIFNSKSNKFKQHMLYICVESVKLTSMRINVGFGVDQTKKEEEDDDDEILEEDIFAALNDP
jgi:hypothetical protein